MAERTREENHLAYLEHAERNYRSLAELLGDLYRLNRVIKASKPDSIVRLEMTDFFQELINAFRKVETPSDREFFRMPLGPLGLSPETMALLRKNWLRKTEASIVVSDSPEILHFHPDFRLAAFEKTTFDGLLLETGLLGELPQEEAYLVGPGWLKFARPSES